MLKIENFLCRKTELTLNESIDFVFLYQGAWHHDVLKKS